MVLCWSTRNLLLVKQYIQHTSDNGKSESRLNVLNFFFGAGSDFVPFIGSHIVQQFS